MILSFIAIVLQMFIYVIFAHAVMSFLFAFGVLDPRGQFAGRIWQTLSSILEPFYRPIRKFVPPVGNIDLTPMVLLFAIFILRGVIGI